MIPPKRVTTLRLAPDERERLDALAAETGKTVTDLLREGLSYVVDRYAVVGKAGLPLGDRDESWDAQAAKDSLDPDQYPDAFFYREDDGDPEAATSYKLGFARNDGGLKAVWAGVTACAVVLQGGRGGVDIPQDQQDQIKSRINGYYEAAATKYDDDSIKPPWQSDACLDNADALARVNAMTEEQFADWAGRAFTVNAEEMADQQHDYRGDDGEDCAICGKPPTDPIHFGQEDAVAEKAEHSITLASGAKLLGFHLGAPWVGFAEDGSVGLADATDAPEQPVEGVEEGDSPPTVETVSGGKPFRAVLAIEGVPTDDGRMIEAGALEWRELPLTLMAMIEEPEMGGHAGSMVSGRIDAIERGDGGQVIGTGVFDSGDFGSEIARLVEQKMLRGVSIDLAVKEYEERWGDDVEGGVEDPFFGESYLMVVKAGVIMGATVCPFPAFADAGIEITASAGHVLNVEKDDRGYVTHVLILGEFAPEPGPDVPTPPTGDGSLMIALFPQEADALADPDGNVPADALHLTLFAGLSGDADAVAQVVDQAVQGVGQLAGTVTAATTFGAGVTPGQDGEPAETAPDADEGPDGAEPADGGDADLPQVLLIDAPGLGEFRFDLADALEAAGITYAEDHDFLPHITTDYDDPADQTHNLGLVGQATTFQNVSIVAADGTRQDVPLSAAVTASAAGMVAENPPTAWFDFPHDVEGADLGEVIPLTVMPDGRVYGYAALFNECHIGMPGKCTPAPHHYQADEKGACQVCGSTRQLGHSKSWYDFFHLGTVETAEGEIVSVGQVTLGKGHAPMGVTAKQAMEHYDDVDSAVADVRAYETPIGIMVAGALRPWASAKKVRQLRGAKLSGDWRSIKGSHEMIGCLAVNVPGYPVPRVRQQVKEFDGDRRVVALVAAGMVPDEPPAVDRHRELQRRIRGVKLSQMLAKRR